MDNLCLAGGVALNCVANGRILRESPFRSIWIQPAAGDAGGALGVAQLIWHRHLRKGRIVTPGKDAMHGAYLGPEYTDDDIRGYLESQGAVYKGLERSDLSRTVAAILADGNTVGWFNGRMEFGPRALGSRSILGDARSASMQKQMNLKIKFRESFRPFAPSVLKERASDFFEMDCESPYMLLVAPVKEERRVKATDEERELWGIELLNVPRSEIPAITHVDYSARIQTVSRETNPDYHALIKAFEDKTGFGIVVNTSFNVRGEPIVCSPRDAYRCFMRTQMDYLVLGTNLLAKADQPEWKGDVEWKDR